MEFAGLYLNSEVLNRTSSCDNIMNDIYMTRYIKKNIDLIRNICEFAESNYSGPNFKEDFIKNMPEYIAAYKEMIDIKSVPIMGGKKRKKSYKKKRSRKQRKSHTRKSHPKKR